MLPQGRRQLITLVVLGILALIAGRWGAAFLTERLWEAQISEAAALVGTRFALLRAALDLGGVLVAVAWFVFHFVWATRNVIRQFGDLPGPLTNVSERTAYAVATLVGTVLGIAAGTGTGSWIGPVLLAVNGVHFGAGDTLLQTDLGVFLGQLPLWDLLHERALAMVIPALLGVTVLASIGGTLRVVDRRIWLAQRARWQFGLLLVAIALTIGWGFALEPYRLAADKSASLGPSEFLLRTTIAELTAVLAAIAAVLTFLWAARLRFLVPLIAWIVLGLWLLGGSILIATRDTGGPLGPQELTTLRRVDTVAFGIRNSAAAEIAPLDGLGPSLWDAEAVSRVAETDSARVLDLSRGSVQVGGHPERVWFLLRTASRDAVELLAVSDDHAGPTGGPATLRWGGEGFVPGLVPFLTLTRHNARPRAQEYDLDPAAVGVSLSSGVRRFFVAWALQVGSILRAPANQRIAWRLDPSDRLDALLPFAQWADPRVYVDDRDVYWVSDGFLSASQFPSSRQVAWHGESVSYLRPAFVGVVRARGGDARIFLRSDADSLGQAWGRIAAPLVEPATAMPAFISDNLGFSPEWLTAQVQVLQGPGWLRRSVARIGRSLYPVQELANLGTTADPYRMPVMSDGGREAVGLLVGPAGGDPPNTQLVLSDTTLAVLSPRELQQRWDKFPFFQQLRDSVRAAGSEYMAGLIRFSRRGDTMVAYQPSYAIGPGSRTALIMVNVALGPRLGAARTYDEAWANLRGETAPKPVGADLTERLEQARTWVERADASLKQGDLPEFARAWSYLRELFRTTPPAPPPIHEP